ncbi:MAG: M15 family metallopeptidase [Endozoicomonas sp.]
MYNLDYAIPIIDRSQLEGSHHSSVPLDRADPRFSEPLVKLAGTGLAFESYHAKDDGNNPPYGFPVQGGRQEGWLRKSLVGKLIQVNERLRPFGVELFILDAYRSMECQQGLWKFFYGRGSRELQTTDDKTCTNYALGYVRDPRTFDPLNSRTFPAHASGAAIDATLRRLDTGELLNMGSRFEEMIDVSYTDYFERLLDSGEIDESDERLQNRRLMHWALSEEGLQSDPLLFWHYDWGNQPYIKVKTDLGANVPETAWYGYIEVPEWETECPASLEEVAYA